ncbi:hypothetical protein BU16DRAFT_522540 [Lophium mytilinum]|uniref:Uncharacterized protein n=1 Tax=Lophium mytilinum TaxID=390894 RepID=A0A6A6RCY9_9PEZI|nr:hypothetical protein BU16DRAFT_522540 [Lophium mytilinum]
MLYTSTIHSPDQKITTLQPATCYFSYVPPSATTSVDSPPLSPSFSLFGYETPSDPSNPLLALRSSPPAPSPPAMDASKLMQLQSSVAHRPRSHPMQPQSSSSSSSSSSSGSPPPSELQTFRCSRCHRTSNWGHSPQTSGMVSFGTNLYYCNRCASIVGYGSV